MVKKMFRIVKLEDCEIEQCVFLTDAESVESQLTDIYDALLGRNRIYPIYKINYETKQVTLKESEKVFLTVLWKDVEIIYDI